ncbi:photosystem II oxygen evolving complex protein PsbP [Synechococcales cyanobacterium C]|uniref:Photosystem II oxygen evolving complex protein PsbP n=1 Tax=Petrachloros mirabilis ULC683 TaxID=2781853 RepID=A0A8K1ZYC5_9CYAN|nr:photosystem II reaction center PsbP [Petrachloros mirabilis]NCJ05887.1 photosystem II oxygen evolving complex protein PsbP [Petrachloros mirabilis ULC683]
MLKRIAIISLLVITFTLQGCVPGVSGLKAYVDSIDGYEFLYPNGWVQVAVENGPDIVFHDLIEETENVSVVVSDVPPGNQLTDLGSPSEVGQRLAQRVIAPPGSNRQAELVTAESRQVGDKTYYNLEYTVQLPIGQRHNLASVAVSRGKLYTLSISAPESRWPRLEQTFEKVAASFSVY